MNKATVQAKWQQLAGRIKTPWGKNTPPDLNKPESNKGESNKGDLAGKRKKGAPRPGQGKG